MPDIKCTNPPASEYHDLSIRIYGALWCSDCLRARQLLEKHNVNYLWIDVCQDKNAEAFVLETNNGMRSIPTIVFEDGSILVEPTNQELMEKLGLA
jgi:glutaredoxin